MASHLYLTGYRGTGKTSVGAIVAQSLGWQIIDLDDEVEKRAKKSIGEIFASGGEETFRELETAALFDLPESPRSVVSLGGGAILRAHNRRQIADTGFTVWLQAEPSTLADRVTSDRSSDSRRPALTDLDLLTEIRDVMASRRSLYQEVSQFQVDTEGKSISEVAEEILAAISRIE